MDPISDEELREVEACHRRNGGTDECICRRPWPCITAALIARLRAAEAEALPDGHVRIDGQVYRVVPSGHLTWVEPSARLLPLPATPEEDDEA